MKKNHLSLKKTTLIGIIFLITPVFTLAEAGKGISDESIILAFLALVIITANQIFLTITSIKKIMKPKAKSSILHYISIVISITIVVIYFPNKGFNRPHLFELFITIPFLLGVISLFITIFNRIKIKHH